MTPNTTESNRLEDLFTSLERAQSERKLPPVQAWQPEHEGTIDIVIRADGTWEHEGSGFTRQALVRLFSTVLRREGERYFLVTPVEKLEINVEDVPFVATDFECRGEGDDLEILFSINSGDHVVADADHRIWMRDGRPYVHVRDGLNALIGRSAFYRLVEHAVEDTTGWSLTSRGARFSLEA